MAVINTNIQLPSTGGTKKNNSTPVITATNNAYSDYFTLGGGTSTPVVVSGNTGGVTDEGVIVGGTPNADNVTFNKNSGIVGVESGTGSTFIPNTTTADGASGIVSNSGNATGTGAGASTSTGAGTGETGDGTSPPTDTETMTYEQYIADQKAREEEKRQAALKEAEIYKERAATDAQASYMQNMSTYGVNAENMAKMGLTGGGYSDYLNAQAYAQKRGEMQTASANEAAMKQQAETTYADNITSFYGQLLSYKEAEKANEKEKATYNAGLKAETIATIEANGGVSVEYINSLKGLGLSDADIQEIVDCNQKYTYNRIKAQLREGMR